MEIIIAFIILVVLLLLGVPVPFSFGGAVIWLALSLGYSPFILFKTGLANISAVVLLAIPMFILAGGIMEKGDIGNSLVDFIGIFFGRVRGSLAIIATIVSAIFGSICGSGAATLSCVGSIIAPRMRDYKYPIGISAAVACCAGPLGLLIPPSGIQILYAWLTNVSVLSCFLATVIPGLLLTTLICITSWVLLRNNKEIIYPSKTSVKSNSGEELKISRQPNRVANALPALFMPVIILGGIYGGILTPTEAAAVSVFYAIPVGMYFYKGFRFRDLRGIFIETSTTTGVIMVMLVFVMMLSRILTMENMPTNMMNVMVGITDNKILLLLLINVFMVIMGMLMDDTSATVLCAPILLPLAMKLGISPYHFAAILGVNLGMGNITPPTAPFLYLAARIFKVDASEIIKPAIQIIVFAYIPTLLLTTFVPELSLTLPRLIMGSKFGF